MPEPPDSQLPETLSNLDSKEPGSMFEEISTRWSQVSDPLQFVMRYRRAIEKYLIVLLRDPEAAAEVRQEFLLRTLQHRFESASPDEGRFRQYLKTAVRNAAWMYLRRRSSQREVGMADDILREFPDREREADQEWGTQWPQCALDRTWAALHRQQQRTPGSLCYAVMRLSVDSGGENDSETLARSLSESEGREIRADAFRKQLSRSRRLFAQLLVNEVAQTLQSPTPENIEAELIKTGLMSSIRHFLPPDWRESWQ